MFRAALEYLATLALADLGDAGAVLEPDPRVLRRPSLLYGFAEYHLTAHEVGADAGEDGDMSFLLDIDRSRVPEQRHDRDGRQRPVGLSSGAARTEGHGAGEEALWDTVKAGRGRLAMAHGLRVQH